MWRQVLVATAPTCWGMAAAASLVVIMGTQYFDGSGATGGQDYPVTDLLQMMGRASRPDKDESGRWAASTSQLSWVFSSRTPSLDSRISRRGYHSRCMRGGGRISRSRA